MFKKCSISEKPTALTISFYQHEGLTIPAILQCCWLDIQVAVYTHGLLVWIRAKRSQNDWRQRDL